MRRILSLANFVMMVRDRKKVYLSNPFFYFPPTFHFNFPLLFVLPNLTTHLSFLTLLNKKIFKVLQLRSQLTEAMNHMKAMSASTTDNVDRRLITNLLVTYISSPREGRTRWDVLTLMSSMLLWTEEEKYQVCFPFLNPFFPDVILPFSSIQTLNFLSLSYLPLLGGIDSSTRLHAKIQFGRIAESGRFHGNISTTRCGWRGKRFTTKKKKKLEGRKEFTLNPILFILLYFGIASLQ